MKLGLLKSVNDPEDRRRKLIVLTRKGKGQYRRLKVRLAEIEQAFLGLYTDIECDLPIILEKAIEALHHTPMLERIRMNEKKLSAKTEKRA